MQNYLLIIEIIIIQFFNLINGQNPYCLTYANQKQNPNSFAVETILYFQCYPPSSNTIIQIPIATNQIYFTQLIMSPNTYTVLPISGICQFININLLDVSNNQLTTITGLFSSLNCLPMLTTLIMANNFIATSIKQADFDDTLCQQLISLDLSYNQIPSIDSNAFIKSDGTTRFKNLQFLSLNNNLIKQFDLLWPLTIPAPTLSVDLSSNPITTLVNGFNKPYSSSVFAYSMTGRRNVNIENNKLQTFSDSNLLQYGLTNSNDLNLFLKMIANYDFRQSNRSSITTITCSCPSLGLQTVSWYKELYALSSINTGALINQLYCNNIANTYPLNIDCSLTTSNTNSSSNSSFGFLSGTTAVTTTANDSLYALLVIPILIILLLLILFCNLRPINKYMFRRCHTTCITSLRPGEKSNKFEKKFDASIIYSKLDEEWVEENVEKKALDDVNYDINSIAFVRNFKIDKIEFENIKKSKRIILVISNNFLSDVWSNLNFKREMKFLNANDKNCSFIAIYFNSVPKYLIDEAVEEIQEYSEESCCYACSQVVRYNFSVKNVELLNADDSKLRGELRFLMPYTNFNDRIQLDIERENNYPSTLSTMRLPKKNKKTILSVFKKPRVLPKELVSDSIITPSVISILESKKSKKPKKNKNQLLEAVFNLETDGKKKRKEKKRDDWNIVEYRNRSDASQQKKENTYFVPIHDDTSVTYVSLNQYELNPGLGISNRLNLSEDRISVASGHILPVFK